MPSFAPTNPTQNQSEAQPAPQEPMVAQNGIETAQPVCRSFRISLPLLFLACIISLHLLCTFHGNVTDDFCATESPGTNGDVAPWRRVRRLQLLWVRLL